MRAKELAKILKSLPDNPFVIMEIWDEKGNPPDENFSVDEVSIGNFVILRSHEKVERTPAERG